MKARTGARTVLSMVVVVCFVLLTGRAFAGGGGEAGKTTGEKVKLTFLSHTYEPWNKKLQAQADAFMSANPNVTIEYSYVMHADLYSKLISALQAKTAPNVMGVYGPWMTKLVNGGYLSVAPRAVSDDIKANYAPFGIDAVTYNNKVYGTIQHIGIIASVVNPDFFENLGEKVPDTWSGYAALADKHTELKDSVVAALEPAGDSLVMQWESLLESFGGSMLSKDLSKVTFNSPIGIQATKTYLKLSNPAFIGTDEVSAFGLGKAGMVVDGPWARTFYEQSEAIKNFYTTIPPKEKERKIASYVWNWVVNAAVPEQVQKASWDFVHYLSNDDNYLDMAKTIGFVPFRKANINTLSSDPWIKGFADTTAYAFVYYPRLENWEELETLLRRELERAIAREIPVEQALANAEAAITQRLKK
jgi:ABC-type glycerol-3-phosphate transport system substrate-binding protein